MDEDIKLVREALDLHNLKSAAQAFDRVITQMDKYAERLEITHVYGMDGQRIEIPREAWNEMPDGIYCRDDTIKGQDRYIKRIEIERAALRKAMEAEEARRKYKSPMTHQSDTEGASL